MSTDAPAIMIVEDEAIVAIALKVSLEEMGYSVSGIVATGEKAVEKAGMDRPDVVLMDICLRERMDGIEAAELIASRYGCPVIFLSAYADYELLERAKKAGPFGYLVKPFDNHELNATIEMALHKVKIETQLRESEERYRSLTDDVLDSSAVGIFILDADFKIVWLNQAVERYFGLERDALIGRDKKQEISERIKHLFTSPAAYAQKVLGTYENNDKKECFECCVCAGEGREERWLEHRSHPIRTGLYKGGRIELYYDITERKKMEQELRKKEKLESIGILAGGIAHDFNNLLSSIIGSISLVKEDVSPYSPHFSLLENAEDTALKAAELAGKFVTFSKGGG